MPPARRRAKDGTGLRGGPQLPVQEGLGDADQHPGDRHGGDRRGRRIARLGRRHGPHRRRPRKRGLRAGTCLLRARRRPSGRHGCGPRAGTAGPHGLRGRDDPAGLGRVGAGADRPCRRGAGPGRGGRGPWRRRGGGRGDGQRRPRPRRRERRGIVGLHDDRLRRGSAPACRTALREAGDRALPGAAGRGRGVGHRLPARALLLRGEPDGLPAHVRFRAGPRRRALRGDGGGSRGFRGDLCARSRGRDVASGAHALSGAGLGHPRRPARGLGARARRRRFRGAVRGGLCPSLRSHGRGAGRGDRGLVRHRRHAHRAARTIFDPARGERLRAAVHDRGALPPGADLAGPALVVEAETTAVVPASRRLRVLADGTLDIHLAEDRT